MQAKKKMWISILFAMIMFLMIFQMKTLAVETITQVATAEELKEAVANKTSQTIQLTADMDITGVGALDISGLVIDLNGHKILADNFSAFFEGEDATIKNGTFDSKGGSYALFIGDSKDTNNMIIENITTIGGINIFASSNVILRNVIATGTNYYAIWCDQGGQVIVENGTFQSDGVAVVGLTTNGSKLQIKGGTFISNGKPLVLESGGKPSISGGNFDVLPKQEYCVEGFEPVQDENGNFIVCNHAKKEIRNEREATCTQKAYTGDTYCQTCNTKLEIGHEYGEVNPSNHAHTEIRGQKEATTKEEGYTGDTYCIDCGTLLKTGESVAKLVVEEKENQEETNVSIPKDTTKPQTGDESNLLLWESMLIISGISFVKISRYKTVRKKVGKHAK